MLISWRVNPSDLEGDALHDLQNVMLAQDTPNDEDDDPEGVDVFDDSSCRTFTLR